MRYRVKAALLRGWFLLMATVSHSAAQPNLWTWWYANPLLGEFALGLALGLLLSWRDGYRVPVIRGYHCLAMITWLLGPCMSAQSSTRFQTAQWPVAGTGLGGIDSCTGSLGYSAFYHAS